MKNANGNWKLKKLQKKLAIPEDEYRAMLRDHFDAASSNELTAADVNQAVAILRGKRPGAAVPEERPPEAQKPKSKLDAKIWAEWYAIQPYLDECQRVPVYFVGMIQKALGRVRVTDGARITFEHLTWAQKNTLANALTKRHKDEEEARKNELIPF